MEKTQKIIAKRHCKVLLTQIDSVEIVEEGNPLFLTLGILTITFFVGIAFIILYFVVKNKYLAIRSGNNVQLVMLNSSNTEKLNILWMPYSNVLKNSSLSNRGALNSRSNISGITGLSAKTIAVDSTLRLLILDR